MTEQGVFAIHVGWTWPAGSYLLISIALVTLQTKADLEMPNSNHYTWKTGQWGRCVGEECGPGGVQTRTVWCVHTDGWTAHPSNCPPTEEPERQRGCFHVCEWHQELFEWEALAWGACQPAGGAPWGCVTAQHGVQRRVVRCVRRSDRTGSADSACEAFSRRPPEEQACLVPCPHDCVVGIFSAWSPCSKTCGSGLQHRTRAVLATPVYGGAGCPNLTQTRTCDSPLPCPDGEGQHSYSLKAGQWSECRQPHHKDTFFSGRTMLDFGGDSSERNSVKRHTHRAQTQAQLHYRLGHKASDIQIGYQTRHVRCTRSDGKNAMLSLCIQDNAPLTFQSCVMPRVCETSDWSPWSPCSKTCRSAELSPGYRTRTRSLKQMSVGGGDECPVLEEREACNIIGDFLPNCPRYAWRTTDWDSCQVQPLLSQQDRRHGNLSALCGGGVQTRETYCTQVLPVGAATTHAKEASRPVNGRLCVGPIPSTAQPCSSPCPQECLLSRWSPWGECLHDNCSEPQAKKGFRQRRRRVLREPAATPHGCPHLVESIPCEEPICSRWHVVQEEACTPRNGTCGPGAQTRTVLCVDPQGEAQPEERCPDDPPPARLPCEVPCPGDCVVGSWAAWTSCSHSCSGRNSEGLQSRMRAVLALPEEGAKVCLPTTALEEWRSCNSHSCMVFYWETSAWGPCTENPSGTGPNGTDGCPDGIQSRRVSCMKAGVGQVVQKRCPESSRPEAIRSCSLPCTRDCVVTPFSEWTACPTFCIPVNSTAATQSRYRIIVLRPANGGQECPDTLYEERECESLPICPTYRWKTHKWHHCTLVPDAVRQGLAGAGESCGEGLETREVWCAGEDDELADVTKCLQQAGEMPQRVRGCRVPCRDDCTLSSWSKFSECSGCDGWRSRKRSLTGRSKKLSKCQKSERYPLVETEACLCNEFRSQPFGNWSVCVLPETQGRRTQREARECGPGLRYRAVACVDQDEQLVDPELCGSSGYVEEACNIPCPLDCKLSDWSSWSVCSASCGSGVKVRSKWLREKPFNGGRPCPKLDLKNQVSEAVPCHNECSHYGWVTESWSACAINAVNHMPGCGEGVQSRKVRCVRKDIEGPGDSVESGLCDPEDVPDEARTCLMPCPDDCVISQWGLWSTCPQPCDQNTVRKRVREILRLPKVGKVCPEATQTEACILNSTCFSYHYNLSDWSSCLLSKNALCGQGVRMRLLDCVRSDGKVVDMSTCEEFGLLKQWKLSTPCEVDCPVNCQLSEWTPWSDCSLTCGNQGQLTRSRAVIQQAHQQGRPCPSQLSQTKPCPIRPCYTWVLGEWSPCRVEGADCGEGLRERNLTCVAHWGEALNHTSARPADLEKCGDEPREARGRKRELSCSVPCPGDCHLTEWSLWSSCQLTCLDGRSYESTGRQARSRAVVVQVEDTLDSCPQQVYESRPCEGGRCHTYEWRSSAWTDNERSVWCQRSDGVNVTGGCFLQTRPTTVRQCYPPCTKPFSHCTQSGVCGCEKGYTEVMTSHGFLDYCTKTPGADVKKADVKTTSGKFRPGTYQIQDFFHDWALRPVGPDGRLKLWVYGVTAGGFVLIFFIIVMSFLVCKKPTLSKSSTPPQKPLSLAYDVDADM